MSNTRRITKADKYKNKVPDYKISSGGGNIHVGVVLDDPAYSSYDLNKPPEAFTSIGADVSLKKSQINANGTPPSGFGQADFQFNVAQNKNDSDSDDGNSAQQNQGYGSNTLNINKNPMNAYIQNNQPQQINTFTERNLLNNTQQNTPKYINNNNNHFPEDYPTQQYQPQEYPQEYPQQDPPQQY